MKKALLVLLSTLSLATFADDDAFTVGCVNCGAFHYNEQGVSPSDYKQGWAKLAAENPANVFFYEDIGGGISSLNCNIRMEDLDICAQSSNQVVSKDVICLRREIEVNGKPRGTARYRALRLVYNWRGGKLAVYGVHLVAESHIGKHSKKLRQWQFIDLIADAKKFDYAILTGDFNAQSAAEYDAFVKAGFTIGNCSNRFGTQATLRNIPADNIIISPGLAFDDFKVKRDYKLNTDHYPVIGRIVPSSHQ